MILEKGLQKKLEDKLYNYQEMKQKDINNPWVKVVDEILKYYKGDIHEEIIRYNYFEQYKLKKIFTLMCIEKTAYYDLREDIIYHLAFLGQKYGLIEPV